MANGRYIFDSVDGFIGFVTQGNRYVTCSDGSASAAGVCPGGAEVTGPVLLFLQSATVPGVPPEQLGRQQIRAHELGLFVQDTWHPTERLTLDLGLRYEATWHPNVFIEPRDTLLRALPRRSGVPLGWDDPGRSRQPAAAARTRLGCHRGRQDGRPRQPRLLRRPDSAPRRRRHRTTNGAYQQILFRSSAAAADLGPVPALDEQIDGSSALPFLPDISVADRNLELPRTWSFSAGSRPRSRARRRRERRLRVRENRPALPLRQPQRRRLRRSLRDRDAPLGRRHQHAHRRREQRRSRYRALILALRGRSTLWNRPVTFETHYTLASDRSDDDNERDPFTFRYANASDLGPEYGWSDRDRRHQWSGYLLLTLPGEIHWNNVVRYLSASPVSERCDRPGERAGQPADRICADGSILTRNTLRRDNAFFTWDLRLSRRFTLPGGAVVEPIVEVFNLTNADNFVDTAVGSLLFNFDGTLRSGLGDTRRGQLGLSVRF